MTVRRRCIAVVLVGAAVATTTLAQEVHGWGDLDALLSRSLTRSGHADMAFWLPNATSPAAATEAVGIVYEIIEGAAGNHEIAVGLLRRSDTGFVLAGQVDDVFGHSPRDVAYYPDRIEFTMTTLNDGDPRCCPTGSTRYPIDRTTLETRQVD